MSRIAHASPVPAHTIFGSDGATASAPMAATGSSSKIGAQRLPPSRRFPDASGSRTRIVGARVSRNSDNGGDAVARSRTQKAKREFVARSASATPLCACQAASGGNAQSTNEEPRGDGHFHLHWETTPQEGFTKRGNCTPNKMQSGSRRSLEAAQFSCGTLVPLGNIPWSSWARLRPPSHDPHFAPGEVACPHSICVLIWDSAQLEP